MSIAQQCALSYIHEKNGMNTFVAQYQYEEIYDMEIQFVNL